MSAFCTAGVPKGKQMIKKALAKSKKQQQATLFKTWGDKGKGPADPSPPALSEAGGSAECPLVLDDEEAVEDFVFNDFDDFLDDELTEAELIQACEVPISTASEDEGPSNSAYNDSAPNNPTVTSSTKHLKQSTIPFHIGPSASTHSILNCSVIEEDIPGFDPEAGEMWIYPTNYPVRDYQFNIVKKSLFINTLVCLPTGLGKTFIAAVVMYNFFRWYPNGKIVFLAPTKPLVSQQIEACHNVMGIPQGDVAEMTGQLPPKKRVELWQQKRVFFLTPQVMQNDLHKGTCPAKEVNCVVFDEAHKALGNHAYCQVIRALAAAEGHYRVLALSATPGNDLKAVQQVVTNLQISHIELRSEDSFDIQQYVHERQVEKMVVPLDGEILDIKNRFVKVLGSVLNRLTRCEVLYHSSPERMSTYQLLQARAQFRTAGPPAGVIEGAIEGDFALAISLYHAFELLQVHGMRSFYQFLKNTFCAGLIRSQAKKDIIRSPLFNNIMKQLAKNLAEGTDSPDGSGRGSSTNTPRFAITRSEKGSDGVTPTLNPSSPTFFYSHPKLYKLEEVVLGHFTSSSSRGQSTRVMIFSQYRDSVQEIADMLSHHLPLIKVMTFVGHAGKTTSKGLTQKEQTEIVRKFRQGGYNTLVATCVGEEGLDIGEVDLIVCFDAAKSPIRLVQRLGRTGRKRSGRIVVIVAEGKEEQIYNKSQSSKNSIHKAIRDGCKRLTLYQLSPRMVPRHIKPVIHKMHMTVDEFVNGGGKGKKKKNTQSKLSKNQHAAFLTDQQIACWSKELSLSDRESRAVERSVKRCMPGSAPFLCSEKLLPNSSSSGLSPKGSSDNSFVQRPDTSVSANSSMLASRFSLSLGKWTHYQNAPIPTKVVGHSRTSEMLRSCLEFSDLLQTSEGMGASYDLEMQTFLDKMDVLSPEPDDNVGGEVGGASEGGGAQRKRKRQRVFVDSSDEDGENAVLPAKRKSKSKKVQIESPENEVVEAGGMEASPSSLQSELHSEIVETDGNGEASPAAESPKNVADERLTSRSPSVNSLSPRNKKRKSARKKRNEKSDEIIFTASQHIVPRAPSTESMDWLDDLDPSQTQSHSQGSTDQTDTVDTADDRIDHSKPSPSELADEDVVSDQPTLLSSTPLKPTRVLETPRRGDTVFRTPKAPPCKRRSNGASVSLSSNTSSKGKTDPPEVIHDPSSESTLLFDDTAMQAIFDDFTTEPLSYLETSRSNIAAEQADRSPRTRQKQPSKSQSTSSKLAGRSKGTNSSASTRGDDDDVIFLSQDPKSTPKMSPDGCARNAESAQSSGGDYVLHHRKRQKRVDLFESPQVGEESALQHGNKKRRMSAVKGKEKVSFSAKRQLINLDSDDDDFTVPLMGRLRRNEKSDKIKDKAPESGNFKGQQLPLNNLKEHSLLEESFNFINDKAELSQDDSMPCEDEDMNDSYDMEDSFINDNSMLTQYTQAPKKAAKKKVKSSEPTSDMYRQSLISPKDKMFNRRKGDANKGRFRMVLSQRHQLLNHYMEKAGFQHSKDEGDEDDGVVMRRHARKRKKKNLDSSTSGSEAEEVGVAYGDEDAEELSQSQKQDDCLDTDQCATEEGGCRETSGSPELFPESEAYHEETLAEVAFLSDLEKEEEKLSSGSQPTTNSQSQNIEAAKSPYVFQASGSKTGLPQGRNTASLQRDTVSSHNGGLTKYARLGLSRWDRSSPLNLQSKSSGNHLTGGTANQANSNSSDGQARGTLKCSSRWDQTASSLQAPHDRYQATDTAPSWGPPTCNPSTAGSHDATTLSYQSSACSGGRAGKKVSRWDRTSPSRVQRKEGSLSSSRGGKGKNSSSHCQRGSESGSLSSGKDGNSMKTTSHWDRTGSSNIQSRVGVADVASHPNSRGGGSHHAKTATSHWDRTASQFQSDNRTQTSSDFHSSSKNSLSHPQFRTGSAGGASSNYGATQSIFSGGTATSSRSALKDVSGTRGQICEECGRDHYNIQGARMINISKFADVIVSPSILDKFKRVRTDMKLDSRQRKGTQGDTVDTGEPFVSTDDLDESFFEDDVVLSQDYH